MLKSPFMRENLTFTNEFCYDACISLKCYDLTFVLRSRSRSTKAPRNPVAPVRSIRPVYHLFPYCTERQNARSCISILTTPWSWSFTSLIRSSDTGDLLEIDR